MLNPDKTTLLDRAKGRHCNGNVSDLLQAGDLDRVRSQVEAHCAGILGALGIDYRHDHNTEGTPARMARMYVDEVFAGRFQERPRTTDFPNVNGLDEMVVVGPVSVRSTCAHHFCPIVGTAVIGVIPSGRIIGLSKFARLTTWVMSRPQIQEEATIQLADEIEHAITPKALGVVVRASHSCMTWRGVRETGSMATTSVMRGLLRDNAAARAEFLKLIEVNGK